MDPNDNARYSPTTTYLQQGDIFRQDIVAPVVDTQQRFFRAADGRHGSVVFSEQAPAHVFDREGLQACLSSCARTQLHTEPFEPTHDGHPELVVANAHLTTHFVIATQTCDVSGKDKGRLSTVIILPILTVMEICRGERIPFQAIEMTMTIEQFLCKQVNTNVLQQENNHFKYPEVVRRVLAEWSPPTTKLQQCRNQIRNYFEKMSQWGWLYFLQKDENLSVPESFVDFSVAYTVSTERLDDVKEARIARIGDPYRDQFAQAFANRLSRIAVPRPMKPDKF